MIRNLVFDFGQVLVHFEPSYMVGRFVCDPQDQALLEEVVFDRLYWDRLDAGTITDEETLAACKTRLPERLHAVAEQIYYAWIYNIPPMEGMEEMILRLKADYPVRLFVLSNISRYFAAHADEIPILRHFEKKIFSSLCGMVKPSREFFGYLCRECDILPEETIFIDDNPNNIRGAKECGIRGMLFDGDAAKLEAALRGALSENE